MNVPHDLAAEQGVLGAMLIWRDTIEAALRLLRADDFYRPAHQAAFEAARQLYERGETADPVTVAAELRRQGVVDGFDLSELTTWQAQVPGRNVESYARVVLDHAARRRVIQLCLNAVQQAQAGAEPSDLVEALQASLATIDQPLGKVPRGLLVLDDLLDQPEERRPPWTILGLLRRDWRIVVVASEGVGKSMLLQQLAVCAAQGVHPLTGKVGYQPVRALLVDLENPTERLIAGCKPIRDRVLASMGVGTYDGLRLWLWHREGGVNLRERGDRLDFEAALMQVQPELVCMGPAYKASRRVRGEGWDEAALDVQRVLDDLRTRYRFGIVMEDHAPQRHSDGNRELRPFGSSLWLRWPDIGLKLVPDDANAPKSLRLDRWRGDRMANNWPTELHRGKVWPWEGRWAQGMGDGW